MDMTRTNKRKDKGRAWKKDIYDDDADEILVGPLLTIDHFESMVEKELEEENVDLVLDSLCMDLMGVYTDCGLFKKNPLIRQCVKTRNKPASYFGELEDHDKDESVSSFYSASSIEEDGDFQTRDEYNWATTQRKHMKATQEPLRLTLPLCDYIRGLPERDVTLYIRLDEQVPQNSCTAYEVDWSRLHDKSPGDLDVTANDCFQIFRWCSRQEQKYTRTECIAGTFASACIHPYTLIATYSGTSITTRRQRAQTVNDDGEGRHRPTKEAPFRPNRLLLDRREDVCTAELRYYLTRMGVSEVHEVQTWLRDLHDAADLDFFPDDPTTTNPDNRTESDSKRIKHLNNSHEYMPSFLAGNIVDERQVKRFDQAWDKKDVLSAFLDTSIPSACMNDTCYELASDEAIESQGSRY